MTGPLFASHVHLVATLVAALIGAMLVPGDRGQQARASGAARDMDARVAVLLVGVRVWFASDAIG